jgi:hypothetical protein
MSLPVKIKGASSGRSHEAKTDNLSAAGVFITTSLPFRKGSKLTFQITLPSAVIGAANNVEVNCAGRVVRVDAANGKRRGVACVIDRYRFVPQKKKSRRAK